MPDVRGGPFGSLYHGAECFCRRCRWVYREQPDVSFLSPSHIYREIFKALASPEATPDE